MDGCLKTVTLDVKFRVVVEWLKTSTTCPSMLLFYYEYMLSHLNFEKIIGKYILFSLKYTKNETFLSICKESNSCIAINFRLKVENMQIVY